MASKKNFDNLNTPAVMALITPPEEEKISAQEEEKEQRQQPAEKRSTSSSGRRKTKRFVARYVQGEETKSYRRFK